MPDRIEPAHMDIASRNARLYEQLKAMGLYVIPVFADEEGTQIDHFHVSAGLPSYLNDPSRMSGTKDDRGDSADPNATTKLRLVPK